ncbi:MAG: molybdopterin molybdotransferase MoeA [Methylococcales bacterium]|nr:molybdopterin molybdotransferase MoeA [Methylococcales bacterium]MCK5925262.1 molybdopterin molybdotransferase MoeA [Methylococcales bacterium]
MIKKQASCSDIYEQGLLPVDQALASILQSVPVIEGFEQLAIEKACRRCLAQNIKAELNVPAYNNSAVDGYAVLDEDLSQPEPIKLKIIGKVFAGSAYQSRLKTGQCLRIMTGAALPLGMKTVLMQEHVAIEGDYILLGNRHHSGENVRLKGEDIKKGEIVLRAGKLLTPPDIGLLASLGIAEIKVKRKLRIAIASSGEEVFALGEKRSSSGLYDSNRYSLLAALDRVDISVMDLGILEDNPAHLLSAFKQAATTADLIISTGGVSVGDADYTRAALQRTGQVDFWKIAIKPGRPLAFGKINDTVFFGLPGNPVAVMVTFYQFVLPAIERMLGVTHKLTAPIFNARALEPIRKRVGRSEVQRGILSQDSQGHWTVKTTGKQGSGILQSMSLANAFILLEHQQGNIETGDKVKVQPFAGLF